VFDPPDPATSHAYTRGKAPRRLDLIQLPSVGRLIERPGARRVLQGLLFGISLIMIGHGLFGPDLAPKNLAALLTWIHFRGLVVVSIVLLGNLFCFACPFTLSRDLARRLFRPRRSWPRALRNKWLAIAMFVAVLFSYELWDFWSSPSLTALLIVSYFVMALLVDTVFQRASFCKDVCPIGQFNFLTATVAPFEVAVRSRAVCGACKTHDCIRGRSANSSAQRGCELALFQPRKLGNLDCTFCLDCVYACPHKNVGILARLPGDELD
jgi:polyferredoxin